jgi:hypothetical protein
MSNLAENQFPANITFAVQRGVTGALEPIDPAPWSSFVTFARALVEAETPCSDLNDPAVVKAAKERMPAIVPARFVAGARRSKASVLGAQIIGLDIDGCPPDAWDAAVDKCAGMSFVSHTSPTDVPDGPTRKGRIYALADRELAPHEVWRARCALAEHLGVRPWLDAATSDGGARIFFAGRLQGSTPREFIADEGHAVPVDALLRHYRRVVPALLDAETEERSDVHAKPAPFIWAAGPEHEAFATPVLVSLLRDAYAAGGRHAKVRALGAVLALNGWAPEAIANVVRQLPSDTVDQRVEQALDAAVRARAGEPVPQRRALAEAFGARIALHVEQLAVQPEITDIEAAAALALTGTTDAPPTPSDPSPIIRITDVYATIEPVPWLCEGWCIAPGAPTIIAGYGGVGKSMLVQLLIVCVVTGTPFLGCPVRKGRVRHYDYEQGTRITRTRYQRLAAAMGVDPRALADGLEIVPRPDFRLNDPGITERLIRECDGCSLAVFDALRGAVGHDLDENDSRIRGPLDMLLGVSDATGCTMLPLHHNRKTSRDNGAGGNQNMRGSGAINDACQTVVMLEGASHGFNVSCGKVRDGKGFKPLGVSISDVDLEREVNFKGLRLAVVDGAARGEVEALAEQWADDASVLTFLSGQPAGRFEGNYKSVWLAMGRKPSRDRVEATLGRLARAGSVRKDGSAFVVTPGTPGVELDINGTPRTAEPTTNPDTAARVLALVRAAPERRFVGGTLADGTAVPAREALAKLAAGSGVSSAAARAAVASLLVAGRLVEVADAIVGSP